MNPRRALLLAVALGGVALIWTAAQYARHVAAPSEGGRASGGMPTIRFFRDPADVPAFTAADLDGREISSASWHGKVVIVNFWATWCPPCRAEIPDLVALQDKYRDQLQIIGVSEDEVPASQVKRFVAEHKINYPVVMTTKELARLFPGVQALPTSFILDHQSRVVQKHVGMLTAEMTELETRALAGLPVNASIERVDHMQGLKLDSTAQLMEIPGVDLASLPAPKRTEALQKLNAQSCTCGCDLTVAKCRVDDPTCGVSLPLAREIVQQVVQAK
jgi:thiol-disulfide isomerase/thioredoxin